MPHDYDLIIIGGGLAGLTAALKAQRAGLSVALIDKGAYPRHRVCGEYVSLEVLPIFEEVGVDLYSLAPKRLSRFTLSSPQGKQVNLALPLGGLGISRFAFDFHLYQVALKRGVQFHLNETVREIRRRGDLFEVTNGKSIRTSRGVISAHGKRSTLDRFWQRKFFFNRSPYLGVKFHAEWNMPDDEVILHNFQAGYCGVSKIENDLVNICYLSTRDHLRKYGSIERMEQMVLHRNPHLKAVLQAAVRVWDKPLVINEISFAAKQPVLDGVLMAGDAAGLITPLCGNGMAMAIQGGNMAAKHMISFIQGDCTRRQMEQSYAHLWKQLFKLRLWMGRNIQAMFRDQHSAELSVRAMRSLPKAARWIIRQTHG
ncbi:MAG: NAD(P)/FAD-dependent oxidoreductase [Bacteroidota bacterium]